MADTAQTNSVAEEQVQGRKDLLWALLMCIAAVVVVRSFLFEPFKIPSSSMVPTLQIGDYIFVSKFNFGLVLPFTKVELVRTGSPHRGDVVVFLFPRDESLHYIKRVVGVPGDKVEFKGKDLVINGQLVPKQRVTDLVIIKRVTGSEDFPGELWEENLNGTVHYVKYNRSSGEYTRSSPPEIVPQDKFFVAGDNRDDSYDSRSWGYVPRENLKGRAQAIWLSVDEEQSWQNVRKVRWNRFGTLIH